MSGTAKKTGTSTAKQTAAAKAKEAAAKADEQTANANSPEQSTTGTTEQPVEQAQPADQAQAEQEALKADSDIQQKEQDDVSKQAKDDEPLLSTDGDPIGVLGALKVRSVSDAGFWRSGVKFHRLQETLVLVVDGEPQGQPAAVDVKDFPPEFVVFMSTEKAKRVHDEPRLVVETVELKDVIDIQD
ncbi:hypothetical protein [Vibrio algicola]|uniref:Uncharacterized protein n=1 Tax=Vibrio algicola TaxID=2662262 RepID=A0A5Q0TMK2_9VIBR|nr:hypothetical protein [Vibrio algicola]